MSDRLAADLRIRLRDRTKHELIAGMIARSPHPHAASRLTTALEAYPLVYLMLVHDYPTRIWILDRGEKASSAGILTQRMLHRRWHGATVGVDDCEGLTDVAPSYLAIVTSWRTLLVMRHEFAHALTTFFSQSFRQQLQQRYDEALRREQFTEPLAARSIGEYAACGLSYYFFPDLRAELEAVDLGLFHLVERFIAGGDGLSARMLAEPWSGSHERPAGAASGDGLAPLADTGAGLMMPADSLCQA